MCKEAQWKNKEKWQDLGIRKAWDLGIELGTKFFKLWRTKFEE
jgi:hypothetical protein